jgi:hypothetical protein
MHERQKKFWRYGVLPKDRDIKTEQIAEEKEENIRRWLLVGFPLLE